MQLSPVELVLENRHQSLVDERGLATPTHSADPDEASQRKIYTDILQVVAPRSLDAQELAASCPALGRNLDRIFPLKVIQRL